MNEPVQLMLKDTYDMFMAQDIEQAYRHKIREYISAMPTESIDDLIKSRIDEILGTDAMRQQISNENMSM